MLNLSFNELKLIAKSGGNKGIKACLEIDYYVLLMRQNQWKKSEKNLVDTESTKNEDYDAHKTLKTTMPDLTKTSKTIR